MQNDIVIDPKDNNLNEISFPAVSEAPVSWGAGDLKLAEKYKAIVNPETGRVFSIVSKDYKLIRHEQAIEKVKRTIARFPGFEKWNTDINFFNDGGRMRMKFLFPDVEVKIDMDDVVNPELQLFNSYDITWPFIIILGAFRLICTNGLVIGQKFLHLRKRHVFDFKQIDLENEVATALKRFNLQTEQWQGWTDLHLSQKSYDDVMKAMKLGKQATVEVEDRMSQEAESFDDTGFPIMSLWVFFNVLTWYITHRAASLNHQVEMERRLRGATAFFQN